MKKDKEIEKAEAYIQEGKLDKALKIFQKLVAKDPADRRLKLKLADIYVRKRNLTQALQTYQEVANGYVGEKFHLKAIAVYKTMLKLNPTMIAINERLGDIYREIGLTKDALSQYFIVADHHEQVRQYDKVVEIRQKIVEADPTATTSRIRLAEIYQKEGKSDEALREYERVARELKAKSDREGLLEVYERILFHRPDQPELLAELCTMYMQRGDYQRARQRLEGVAEPIRKDRDVMEILAEVYIKLEQRENARRFFRNLYEASLKARDGERATRVFSRIQQEFGDEVEYLEEMKTLRAQSGFAHEIAPPRYREDLEKTTMVRLSDYPFQEREEVTPVSQSGGSGPDLEKTDRVDLKEFEKYLREKGKNSKQ